MRHLQAAVPAFKVLFVTLQVSACINPCQLYAKFAKHSVSAATREGALDYEALHKKLSTVKPYVDEKVLKQMIRFFAAQIPLADQQLLSQLYDSAKASPLTSTRMILRMDEGLVFNGAFAGGMPSRCEMDWLVSSTCLVFKWPRVGVCLNAPQLSTNRSLCEFCSRL